MQSVSPLFSDAAFRPKYFPQNDHHRNHRNRGQRNDVVQRDYSQVSSSLQVNQSLSTSRGIEITTAEGDRVTISQSSLTEMNYSRYDASGVLETPEGSGRFEIHAESRTLSASRDFSIQVEGELNDREREEIRLVLDSVDRMMTDFLSGDIEGVLGNALEMGELSTIASAEANLSYSRSVSVEFSEQAQRVVESTRGEGAGKEVERPGRRIGTRDVERLIDKMLRTVERHSDNPAKLARKLPKMIDRLLRKINKKFDGHEGKQKLANDVASRFLERLDRFAGRIETKAPVRPEPITITPPENEGEYPADGRGEVLPSHRQ